MLSAAQSVLRRIAGASPDWLGKETVVT